MFDDHKSYQNFSNSVRNSDRFAFSAKNQAFLDTFKRGIHERKDILKKDTTLFRAVRDYAESEAENGSPFLTGANEARMLPKKQFAFEGRANPNGLVVLYLASTPETAVTEVRPWIGELISIGWFSVNRDLKIANLAKGHDKSSFLQLTLDEMVGKSKVSLEKSNECTWIDIDNAFSRPTTKTDTGAEYVPTQILSAAAKNEGFDGIFYKSSFGGDKGYNIALFNMHDATLTACNAFGIDDIKVKFSQAGNGWAKKE